MGLRRHKTGQKTRTMLTIYRLQHPRADIDHLYIQRNETGRGILQIEGFYVAEITNWCNTGCPRRNVPDFRRVLLMLKYTDITQNTYIQS